MCSSHFFGSLAKQGLVRGLHVMRSGNNGCFFRLAATLDHVPFLQASSDIRLGAEHPQLCFVMVGANQQASQRS